MRERPIPWAYRVFFRQIGLDPDRDRTPVEQLALDRLHDGGFRSRGPARRRADDRHVETGVALRAFDADRLEGPLCIRDVGPGRVARRARRGELAAGTLTIADESRPGRPPLRRHRGGPRGRAATAAGSPIAAVERQAACRQIAVEEALWIAASTLEAA